MARSLRSFMISFLITLVIVSTAAYYIVPYLNTLVEGLFNADSGKKKETYEIYDEPDDEKETEDKKSGVAEDLNGSTFATLLILMGEDDNVPDSYILMKADRERRQFMFTAIPANLIINFSGLESAEVGGKPVTLATLYNKEDMCKDVIAAVSAITGIKVDFYIAATRSDYIKVVDYVGGILYDVETDMRRRTDSGKYDINLQKGTQVLDGEHALMYLIYDQYSTDVGTQRRTAHLRLLKAALEQNLTSDRYKKAKDTYEYYTDFLDTNIDLATFSKNSDLLFMYNTYTVIPEITFPISSIKNTGGESYCTYDSESVRSAYSDYR